MSALAPRRLAVAVLCLAAVAVPYPVAAASPSPVSSPDTVLHYLYAAQLAGSHLETWPGYRQTNGLCGLEGQSVSYDGTHIVQREVALDPTTCTYTIEIAPLAITPQPAVASTVAPPNIPSVLNGCVGVYCSTEHDANGGWNNFAYAADFTEEFRCLNVPATTDYVCPTYYPLHDAGQIPSGDDAAIQQLIGEPNTFSCTTTGESTIEYDGTGWHNTAFNWAQNNSCSSWNVQVSAKFSAVDPETLYCLGANVYFTDSLTLLSPYEFIQTSTYSYTSDGPAACTVQMAFQHTG